MQLAGPHSMLEIDEAGQVSARTRKQLRLISPLPCLRRGALQRIDAVKIALTTIIVVSITANVTLAKMKPANLRPLRSAIIVPRRCQGKA